MPDPFPSRTFGPLTRTDIVRYQGASGDFNPIHHDEEFARQSGSPTVFSVGMLQAGLLATYCTELFGAGNVLDFEVRFRDRVWPGDVLTCHATLDESAVDAGPTTHLVLVVERADGAVVVTGRATVTA